MTTLNFMSRPGGSTPATRVLVVDDDARILRVLARLSVPQLELTLCTSAEAALSELSRAEVDVFVSDVEMPGMSGIELCRTLQIRHPELPVVLVTGDANRAASDESIGPFAVLAKPCPLDVWIATVRRAHRYHRVRVATC